MSAMRIKLKMCNKGYNDTNNIQKYFNIEKILIHSYNSEETELGISSHSINTLENNSSSNVDSLTESQKNKVSDKKNDLRQNLMAPLTWALSKTLKNNPTNPIHYIACQLLRWKYNNIGPKEKDEITEFVIDATVQKDSKLSNKKLQQQEKETNKSKNISYQQCRCKNVKKYASKIVPCQFPAFCRSCQITEPVIS